MPGIAIRWQLDCGGTEGRPSFEIRLGEGAPPSATSEALASTRVRGAAITVYNDRMRRRLGRAHPAAWKIALAYVFAHELARAMQGIPRHSDSGILKAEWSDDDFTAMLFDRLAFTKFDVDLMRSRLSARAVSIQDGEKQLIS